jgi:hypothetical protein
MKRVLLVAATMGAFALSVAGPAAASGPAAPGKKTEKVECVSLGPINVSVSKGPKSLGAAQIIAQQGHGKVVSDTITATDERTEEAVFSETFHAGGAMSHSNQTPYEECNVTLAEGVPATEAFPEGLPENVLESDTIKLTLKAQVVVRP